MAEYEDGRRHDVGDVIGELECVAVSFNTVDGRNTNFTYQFKPKAEMDAVRKAEVEHQEAEKERLAEVEKLRKAEEAEELAHRNEA